MLQGRSEDKGVSSVSAITEVSLADANRHKALKFRIASGEHFGTKSGAGVFMALLNAGPRMDRIFSPRSPGNPNRCADQPTIARYFSLEQIAEFQAELSRICEWRRETRQVLTAKEINEQAARILAAAQNHDVVPPRKFAVSFPCVFTNKKS